MSQGHERRRDDPAHPGHHERWPSDRSRKNLRELCRGKAGRLHKPEIVKQSWARNRACREPLEIQGWWRQHRGPWICWHQESCADCGKVILRTLPWWMCPDLPAPLRDQVPQDAR